MLDQQQILKDSQLFFTSSLFHQVQISEVFSDSKTFADATPKHDIADILSRYEQNKEQPAFCLAAFVNEHFVMPVENPLDSATSAATSTNMQAYIDALWPQLTRQAKDQNNEFSLLKVPGPYIIPGGRFREIYYWDSYFTALGLMDTDHQHLIVDMMRNFASLQHSVGSIPNGNRTYYVGRSQPPILALMVELILSSDSLLTESERAVFVSFAIDALNREYDFWMAGNETLSAANPAVKRVIRMDDGAILNRFWDDSNGPRPESYREDIDSAAGLASIERPDYWRHLRAACESGWDFSSRWLDDAKDLTSIRTTDILPVDLNSLLYCLEHTLANLYQQQGELDLSKRFNEAAQQRKGAINRYCWDQRRGAYFDYDIRAKHTTDVFSAASFVPLFMEIASTQQAHGVVTLARQKLFCENGIKTTDRNSPQQWDNPNGWAPLQWFAVEGLRRYGFTEDAKHIASGWCDMVETYFNQHHRLMEKYNLDTPLDAATGGEYDVQHGFGWTNGVTMALKRRLATL